MKLAVFSTQDRASKRVGVVVDGGIADLSERLSNEGLNMLSIIRSWNDLKSIAAEVSNRPREVIELSKCRLHAPIERPGKIMAIGLNYLDHILESGLARPATQLWFAKASTSAHDPFEPIQIPAVSDQVDYEAELVAVIGLRIKHATQEQAKKAIFGFCVGNDVSVRDWQMQTPQWFLGKSFDTHAPFGPWITTADEVGDPHQLGIRCLVNGECRQDSNTKHLVFNVYDQVVHLSQAMTLEPGDIIFTGTPGGVGFVRKPPSWLKSGDKVRVEIDRIGAIEARMAKENRE